MRVTTDSVQFQPMTRVEVPQFAGLQTPLVGGSRRRAQDTERTTTLARFTPVKVLSTNGRSSLIQLANGERGFVPAASIATESTILATAKPAEPARPLYSNTMPIDPTTGLPYDSRALYVPRMDASDAPVDAAMLNNVDSIPLPESERSTVKKPEAQNIDGVLIRRVEPVPADQPPMTKPAPSPTAAIQ